MVATPLGDITAILDPIYGRYVNSKQTASRKLAQFKPRPPAIQASLYSAVLPCCVIDTNNDGENTGCLCYYFHSNQFRKEQGCSQTVYQHYCCYIHRHIEQQEVRGRQPAPTARWRTHAQKEVSRGETGDIRRNLWNEQAVFARRKRTGERHLGLSFSAQQMATDWQKEIRCRWADLR